MTQMNETRTSSHATSLKPGASLLAAVLAVPFLAALPARVARAQFQVTGGGHANDANNQVGSGGFNTPSRPGNSVTSNNIVYNEVTGLRGFSAKLQSTDPTAFRGATYTFSADRFIGQSNPTALRGTPSANVNYYTPTAYYSDATYVAPPAGSVRAVGNSGYVPSSSIQAGQFSNQLTDQAANGGFKTGAGNSPFDVNLNPTDGINGPYTPYGTDFRLGPTDPSNQQSFLMVSPLSGVQQGQLNNGSDSYFLSRTQLRQLQQGDRFQRIDDQTLQQMRREVQEQAQQQAGPNGQPQNPDQLNNSILPPLEAPNNKPLEATVGSSLSVAQPLQNTVGTQEGMYRTVTAAQQTPVLSELDRRLDQYKQRGPAAEEKEAKYQADLLKAAGAAKPGSAPGLPKIGPPNGTTAGGGAGASNRVVPGTGGGSAIPFTPASRTGPDIGAVAGGTRTEPVHITSLAAGVKAKGLAGLLTAAEEMMKAGKYTSAIDQYSLAQQIAPNNPLIPLGQANAELGAASYRDAEQHLRQVFAGDMALLHAQFDLNSVLGPQRVRTLMDDLKQLAAADPKAEMPVFLLAYMNYNTGHEAEAMKNLDEVEKREGHADAVVARMRQHWYVPTGTKPATPELNK